MKHILHILLLAAALPLTIHAADAPAAATAEDGVWKPIAAVMGGVRLPKPALDAITLTIKGTNYEVTAEGDEHSDKGTQTRDTTTTPMRITIKSTEGANKGKTFLAIYEMKDANSMRVCYDLSGKEFPKEFKAPKGTQLYLVGYRRQTDAEPAVPSFPFNSYPSDPRVKSNGGNQAAQMSTAFSPFYSVETTLTPLNVKGGFEVVVRISQLVEVKGQMTENVISQPKLVSELGVPASIYLGPEPTSRNYLEANNITVGVSWSKTGKTSVASCAVTIKRGDKLVWKSKMQTVIANENHNANGSAAVPSQDVGFVEAKPALKLSGATFKLKSQTSAASSAAQNPASSK